MLITGLWLGTSAGNTDPCDDSTSAGSIGPCANPTSACFDWIKGLAGISFSTSLDLDEESDAEERELSRARIGFSSVITS
jgi:hypothetical protein